MNDDNNAHMKRSVTNKRKLLVMGVGCWVQIITQIISEIFKQLFNNRSVEGIVTENYTGQPIILHSCDVQLVTSCYHILKHPLYVTMNFRTLQM
jgi:hypothetical protein